MLQVIETQELREKNQANNKKKLKRRRPSESTNGQYQAMVSETSYQEACKLSYWSNEPVSMEMDKSSISNQSLRSSDHESPDIEKCSNKESSEVRNVPVFDNCKLATLRDKISQQDFIHPRTFSIESILWHPFKTFEKFRAFLKILVQRLDESRKINIIDDKGQAHPIPTCPLAPQVLSPSQPGSLLNSFMPWRAENPTDVRCYICEYSFHTVELAKVKSKSFWK